MQCELDEILAECYSEDLPIKNINYKGLFVTEVYEDIADSIEEFEVRDDDIWVCSFPRTGTTWTQEMVWNIANDLDFNGAQIPLELRFPFLEYTGTTTTGWVSIKKPEWTNLSDDVGTSMQYPANLSSPRFIKSHLPFHLLPRQLRNGEKSCKIIYVVRNPKDTCISYYHHYKMFEAYCSSFENFCQLFLKDKVYYAPFWDHVIGFWKVKDKRDILCLKYEDMQSDLSSAIRKTADYLGKTLNDEQVIQLKNHLNFTNMKNNPSVNKQVLIEDINKTKLLGKNFKAEGEFIRKGIVGQWKDVMSKEVIKEFDDWTDEKFKDFKSLRKEFP